MVGEHLPPRLLKVPAPASYVWMCATFQKDLFSSLVSGTDSGTDTEWALSLSPPRGLVFSDKGLKSHQLQGGSRQLSEDTRNMSRF